MISTVKMTISNHKMLCAGDTVVVALSGGADSVALLYFLKELSKTIGFSLRAAHVNHNIRGEQAVRDENFCRDLCRKWDIPLDVKFADIPKIAREQKISEELAGRNERYSFFTELSAECTNTKIATAHNASDNIETVVYNIVRGAGVDGLCGIPYVRGNIIRPLLDCGGAEIRRFCTENRIDFVFDSTNNQLDYNRNKIRNLAIPVLREINPSLEKTFARLNENISEVRDFLCLESERLIKTAALDYGYKCDVLNLAHKAVKNRAIAMIAEMVGIENLEKKHIDLCDNIIYNGGIVSLPENFQAVSKQGVFRIVKILNDESPLIASVLSSASDNGAVVEFEDKICKIEFIGGNSCQDGIDKFSPGKCGNNEILIPLNGEDDVVLRTRRDGDRFTLPRRKVTKSLKKLFNEMKIPSELRSRLLVLEQNNKIIWIEKIGCAAKTVENPEFFIKLSIYYHN